MAHGGGKEDESAALWLPAPAATRPPPAADPREGPRGRHPAAGRARASPKHQGVRWAQRSAFSPLGPGLREETSCASGPGRAQADPRAAGASSGDGGGAARGPELGGGTSCGRGGGGWGGAWLPGELLPTRRPGPLGCSGCRVGCGRRGETRPHAKATRGKPALYLGVPSVFASSQTKSEGRGTLVPAAG